MCVDTVSSLGPVLASPCCGCRESADTEWSRGELVDDQNTERAPLVSVVAASVRDVSKRRHPVVLCYREQEDLDDQAICEYAPM